MIHVRGEKVVDTSAFVWYCNSMMKRNQFDAGAADAIRREKARETDRFRLAYDHAQTVAHVWAQTATFDDLKAAGGWTAVIRNAFNDSVGDAVVPGLMGRPMPMTALFTEADVADIRLKAQTRRK